jgi:hypothetical protein
MGLLQQLLLTSLEAELESAKAVALLVLRASVITGPRSQP